jgi:hypothetical protein
MTRLVIFNGDSYGLSPAAKNFTINWVGSFNSAVLEIDFGTSFGYGLTGAILNGVTLHPKNDGLLKEDVKDLLKQGDNKLTVTFNAVQLFGTPLGQAVITGYIDYFGASVLQTPSVQQAIRTLEIDIKKNLTTVLVGIFGFAVIVGSLAYLSSRLPNAGHLKAPDLASITKKAKSASTAAQGHLKHAIMTIREKAIP